MDIRREETVRVRGVNENNVWHKLEVDSRSDASVPWSHVCNEDATLAMK